MVEVENTVIIHKQERSTMGQRGFQGALGTLLGSDQCSQRWGPDHGGVPTFRNAAQHHCLEGTGKGLSVSQTIYPVAARIISFHKHTVISRFKIISVREQDNSLPAFYLRSEAKVFASLHQTLPSQRQLERTLRKLEGVIYYRLS